MGGQSYLCDVGADLFSKGMTTNDTVRRHIGEEALMATTQLGRFLGNVAENSLVESTSQCHFTPHTSGVVRGDEPDGDRPRCVRAPNLATPW